MACTRALAVIIGLACCLAPSGRSAAQVTSEPAIVLDLNARHRMLLNGKPISARALIPALDVLTSRDHEREISLRANPDTVYRDVIDLVTRLRLGGYERVGLLAPARPAD